VRSIWTESNVNDPVTGLVFGANDHVVTEIKAVRILEGSVWSNRDRRTLLDKMLALLGIIAVEQPFYFVADA
jgi:hypothetical protein